MTTEPESWEAAYEAWKAEYPGFPWRFVDASMFAFRAGYEAAPPSPDAGMRKALERADRVLGSVITRNELAVALLRTLVAEETAAEAVRMYHESLRARANVDWPYRSPPWEGLTDEAQAELVDAMRAALAHLLDLAGRAGT